YFGLAHNDGSMTYARHKYKVSYPNDIRTITPSIIYPYGEDTLELAEGLDTITHLAVRDTEDAMVAVAADKTGVIKATVFSKDENLITEEVELTAEHFPLPSAKADIISLLLGPDQRWIYVVDSQGSVTVIDFRDRANPVAHEAIQASNADIVTAKLLLGGNSLLIGDSKGVISQWVLVRDDNNEYQLQALRRFASEKPKKLAVMATELRRKGFVGIEEDGTVSLYNTTAENRVLSLDLIDGGVKMVTLSPRANGMLIEDGNGQLSFWKIENEHPEVSWSALWNKVWYEGYQEPDFIWQSSAANNDFEPKYSLMPLAFGTLKAAFYAMLLATPLAICGAIYTAYFMAPALRTKIKPFIELMEALPTVILGFLAGLWLAPFIETNLASIFTILVVIPLGVLAFAFLWQQMPKQIRFLVPEGWDAAVLIPVIILLTLFCMPFSELVEDLFFGGDMRYFVSNDLGITFDQRNALVVGLAMGFAVIPTIFSITEDAIFSVPKHLSNGSLALGATPWQTLTRVVLPTASPGIFSAVMIGMGRAVGETMIVLMATGNTPIMDMNIFEGMRTLAANIAVEMPESEVGSSHYRILFLAALVLFAFTFMVNTLAEVIRQRLRLKYGSL
ncbi:MAG: ABC transporter permease subunit, partial [Motiliproteus sp.]|nr:ABC transporter permease subunit [Motiliproteus sp.]